MAYLYLLNRIPEGFRLKDIFAPIIGNVTYGSTDSLETARFNTSLPDGTVLPITYRGPEVSADNGDVGFIRAGSEDAPLVLYGDLIQATQSFSYEDLASFQQGAEAAAALIMAGNDTIIGYSDHDYLEGYAGNDWLSCGSGADTMAGGKGDDTYVVASAATIILESVDEGDDTVEAEASYTLPAGAYVETLRAKEGPINLTGNEFANAIFGSSGSNVLSGGAGHDQIYGLEGNDTLRGESGSDTLHGGADNDYASGGQDNDVIFGDEGNDTLYGDDGTDVISGSPGNDVIYGGADADNLNGNEDNDWLSGDSGDDILYGDAGNDVLMGGSEDDVISGGDGSDAIFGESGNDRLSGGSENDMITGGDGNDAIYGEAGDDNLQGQSGDDVISGGLGVDTMSGGSGKDVFVFNTKPNNKANLDRILDYNVKDDTIQLSRTIFKAAGKKGLLKKDAFWIGEKAHDSTDRLIYNSKTGVLSYDADGNGASSAVSIAILTKHLKLKANDFLIV